MAAKDAAYINKKHTITSKNLNGATTSSMDETSSYKLYKD
jgi:hypothetical protein